MNSSLKPICPECGEPLEHSQYARALRSDGSAVNADENLACRNFPHCKKAEVESRNGGCGCDEPQCAKCLSVNCTWVNCPVHTREAKIAWRKRWELANNKPFPESENF
jgi:hypothetical protein